MKKVLVALAFTMAAMSSQAALVFNQIGLTQGINFKNDITGQEATTGDEAPVQYQYGFLSADAGDVISFTNLGGSEAGFTNLFINGENVFDNKTNFGSSFNYVATGGNLIFSFESGDDFQTTDINGSANIAVIAGLFGNQFALLYNDAFDGHTDFDDHAIGVNAVPVPAALPLMASALGAFGIARRRNKSNSA